MLEAIAPALAFPGGAVASLDLGLGNLSTDPHPGVMLGLGGAGPLGDGDGLENRRICIPSGIEGCPGIIPLCGSIVCLVVPLYAPVGLGDLATNPTSPVQSSPTFSGVLLKLGHAPPWCFQTPLEGTARYAGLILAPAEGFGLRPRLFLPFGQKKRLL